MSVVAKEAYMASQPHERMTLLRLVFDDDPQAHEALEELKALNAAKRIKVKAAAVVSKNLGGKIKVKPMVLALIEPLWIQDFVQALVQSPITPAPQHLLIGLNREREDTAYPFLFTNVVQEDLPTGGSDSYQSATPPQ
jgi:hypothetical protein